MTKCLQVDVIPPRMIPPHSSSEAYIWDTEFRDGNDRSDGGGGDGNGKIIINVNTESTPFFIIEFPACAYTLKEFEGFNVVSATTCCKNNTSGGKNGLADRVYAVSMRTDFRARINCNDGLRSAFYNVVYNIARDVRDNNIQTTTTTTTTTDLMIGYTIVPEPSPSSATDRGDSSSGRWRFQLRPSGYVCASYCDIAPIRRTSHLGRKKLQMLYRACPDARHKRYPTIGHSYTAVDECGTRSSVLIAYTLWKALVRWNVLHGPHAAAKNSSSGDALLLPDIAAAYAREFVMQGGFRRVFVTVPRKHRHNLDAIASVMRNFYVEIPAQCFVFDLRLLENLRVDDIVELMNKVIARSFYTRISQYMERASMHGEYTLTPIIPLMGTWLHG
ncbi:MAG TPA: hypothetical protein VLA24_14405, partial [Pseudomonadales bacterium]|nr:hypothetical protein [Pseudomonadales bacterium]